MTLNLSNPDTVVVFDPLIGLNLITTNQQCEMSMEGCEYSESNIGFDL